MLPRISGHITVSCEQPSSLGPLRVNLCRPPVVLSFSYPTQNPTNRKPFDGD